MELYRNSSVGLALSDALDEMITMQQISPALEEKIKAQFDISVARILKSELKNKVTFKATCHTYNKLESVHRYCFSDIKVKLDGSTVLHAAGNTKLVACDINAV
mmetsp:Transcript_13443/g.34448  ORF Transcript_13443/g.34448 Transcript_13443/m.34448 type:complete len:104 (-) Transcript_13443:111-422(-)|eukprot:CAMPEP_0182925620 /NCGR_PEP_ID=MMETSP0105_2-20130417/9737_1 /TAXON_ID=81532 ORGANISM="Acanthoeca-like sp., Strain 10tr" /NCGR_SAMPLE_ID=MMETSP0105_2 /ASSEMBLY_ACC=CAM_ASM_000205 /LENGTH=103 /DNA_ID=CAMNT_0025063477 /DNA_START=55 /DNA_END=366 /DNA_ORIENTATION=+